MTPQELVKSHIIKRIYLNHGESIDYSLVPNYEQPCKSQGFSLNDDNSDNEYYWEEAVDLDDRDYFSTPKEAWINCAKANDIQPSYLKPLQDIVVTQWLYEKLLKKGQPVEIYQNQYTWGRPTNDQEIYMDNIIIEIAHDFDN